MSLRSIVHETGSSDASNARTHLTFFNKNQVQVAHTRYGEPATIPVDKQSYHPSAYHPVARDFGVVGRRSCTSPISTSATDPASEWLRYKNLQKAYRTQKRKFVRMVDPIAQRAVANIDITQFVQPTNSPSQIPAARESLLPAGFPSEDLGYSLRNFLVVNPVHDPNVVFARIAIREGRTKAGCVPLMPQPQRIVPEWEVESSKTCGSH